MIVWIEAVGCANACCGCPLGSRLSNEPYYTAAELRELAGTWGHLTPLEEATLHPEFPELLGRDITPKDMTYLATNGDGIVQSDDAQNLFAQLREIGYEGINITFHGMEHWHDWFVGRKGAFGIATEATRRAADAGFYVHWRAYLNRRNLGDMASLRTLAQATYGGSLHIALLGHPVHPRWQWHESVRPSLQEVRKGLPDELIAEEWGDSLESFTERSWLQLREGNQGDQVFRHPFEPEDWPPTPPLDRRVISITRDRRVYFDPQWAPPSFLGHLSEGRGLLLGRLDGLADPYPDLKESWPAYLVDEDRELLHGSGISVRYKAITSAIRSKGELVTGEASLDFCGHF